MVSKKIPAHTWSFQSLGQYVGILQLQMNDMKVAIINVYNSRGNGPQIQTWDTIQRALRVAKREILLLGDFNAHHPAWGGPQAACEPQSEHLNIATLREGLALLTPRGLPTWRRGTHHSVIDLTFTTEAI